ncbi:MAG: hypothetical protein WBM17_07515 [Anaerolineales bacterium]
MTPARPGCFSKRVSSPDMGIRVAIFFGPPVPPAAFGLPEPAGQAAGLARKRAERIGES